MKSSFRSAFAALALLSSATFAFGLGVSSWTDLHAFAEGCFDGSAEGLANLSENAFLKVLEAGVCQCAIGNFGSLGEDGIDKRILGIACRRIRIREIQGDGQTRIVEALAEDGSWREVDRRKVLAVANPERAARTLLMTLIDESAYSAYLEKANRLKDEAIADSDSARLLRLKADSSAGELGLWLSVPDATPITLVETRDDGSVEGVLTSVAEDTLMPLWLSLSGDWRRYSLCSPEKYSSNTVAVAVSGVDTDGDGLSDVYEAACGTDPKRADTDGDGVSDYDELFFGYGSDPLKADTDGDGLSDGEEKAINSNPNEADTDGDGLDDVAEAKAGTNPTFDDTDIDGLTDIDEINLYHTDPVEYDSDGDGLSDGREIELELDPLNPDCDGDGLPDGWEQDNGLDPFSAEGNSGANGDPDGDGLDNMREWKCSTKPLEADSDGDGLSDKNEIDEYGTLPRSADSDNDGLSDDLEIELGTDPRLKDTDGDGLDDCFEHEHGYDPTVAQSEADLQVDSDGDGLSDLMEIYHGTDPLLADTDGDGIVDGLEVEYGYDPLVAIADEMWDSDEDYDGLTLSDEIWLGTNPTRYDTDGDGFNDGWEVGYGWDPLVHADEDDDDSNDTDADPDGDGVANYDEYLRNRNPGKNDDLMASDTPDAAMPPTKAINFQIGADCATWELEIIGIGEYDKKVRRMSTRDFNEFSNQTFTLVQSNLYELVLHQLDAQEVSNGPNNHSSETYYWNCWSLAVDGAPSFQTYKNFSDKREAVGKVICGNGWVITNLAGIVSDQVHISTEYCGSIADGQKATLLLVPVVTNRIFGPVFRFGTTRNSDRTRFVAEKKGMEYSGSDEVRKVMRFWKNDDYDLGFIDSLFNERNDLPGAGSNFRDNCVNGERDLLDFTPVVIDFSKAFLIAEGKDENVGKDEVPGEARGAYRWTVQAPHVNILWTSLNKDNANCFLSNSISCGDDLDTYSKWATVTDISEETEIPEELRQEIADGGSIVLLVEGKENMSDYLEVRAYLGEIGKSNLVRTDRLKLEISSVEQMFRTVNMRYALTGRGNVIDSGEPPNRPYSECDAGQIVFVHGYNVNSIDSRIWSSEMFKRFWQSGMRRSFVSVDWYGDQSQFESGLTGKNSLDYYANVRNAFLTARPFASFCKSLSGPTCIVAHSLGNMLACAAIRMYQASYNKILMVNAAVPAEAFNGGEDLCMIPLDWILLPRKEYSANWCQRFSADDFRSTLTWRGFFSNIRPIVYFSEGDSVLSGSWRTQERIKGTLVIPLVNSLFKDRNINITSEAGWGFNLGYEESSLPSNAPTNTPNRVANQRLWFSPFIHYSQQMLSGARMSFENEDESYRAKAIFLADAIPALSKAIGDGDVIGGNDLGEIADIGIFGSFGHSDIKNRSYYEVRRLFDDFLNQAM